MNTTYNDTDLLINTLQTMCYILIQGGILIKQFYLNIHSFVYTKQAFFYFALYDLNNNITYTHTSLC